MTVCVDLSAPPLKTLEDLQRAGIRFVRMSFSDLHGVCRSKDLPLEVFAATHDRGSEFVAAIFALDLASNPLDVPGATFGPSLGYPDMRVVAKLETLTRLPGEQHTAWCLGDIAEDSPLSQYSPRALLARVVARYRECGLSPIVGPEVEFYLLRRGEGGCLQPYIDRPAMVYTTGVLSDPAGVVRTLLEAAQAMDLRALASTAEFSPGQYEINLLHGEALDAADRAFRFRAMVKEIATRFGLLATFMGKPLADAAGCGLHLHVSVRDGEQQNAFDQPAAEDGISPLARRFLAGVLDHAQGLMAILAPTINAYKRLAPNNFVPLAANWGLDNRTVFVRIPAGRGEQSRVEVRGGDASANPYLAMAAVLLAGLDGIKRELDPPAPVQGDVGGAFPQVGALPRTLEASLAALRADSALCELLGQALVETFCAIKESELQRFHAAVTDWEVREYAWHL